MTADWASNVLWNQILDNEFWFHDGPPLWNGAPSVAQAEQEAARTIKSLRHGTGDPARKTLASRLARCRPDRRCQSCICPLCARAGQRWFVKHARLALKRSVKNTSMEIRAVSLVPSWKLMPDEDGRFDLHAFGNDMRERLDAGSLHLAIGGVDFSRNQGPTGTRPYWQPHLYMFVGAYTWKSVGRQLAAEFPSSDHAPRPVRSKKFEFSRLGVSYALKTNFYKRVRFRAKNGRMSTRSISLKPYDRKDLFVKIGTQPWHERILCIGFEVGKNAFGGIELQSSPE